MQKILALVLVIISGVMLFQSGMEVYYSMNSKKNVEPQVVELDRIEGQYCPLYFPKE